jgi:hypothetical protein
MVVGIMKVANANLVNLCDVGTILGLPCVLPMLEFVNALMKFVQTKDVTTLQQLKSTKPIYTKCIMTPPLHSNLRAFLSLQMLLQSHIVKLFKIGSLT